MATGKVALVLEGGGFRGQFTTGALDVLMENGLDQFGAVFGVSAGAIAAAAASKARAAILPAVRMRSTVPGSLTSEAVTLSGPSWNMYSGRAIDSGTSRRGPTMPGTRVPRGARSAPER